MAGCCHENRCSSSFESLAWRRVLWIALIVNGAMFVVEILAGLVAGSSSLQADALDFLADTANYGISLSVAGLPLVWRARAALVKGISMGVLGLWVAFSTVWHALSETIPEAEVMGIVGLTALLANVGVALLLYRFRHGEANMLSVWVCSRNDAVGNVAVILAAAGVFGTGTGWPDILVAAIIMTLAFWGAIQVTRQATGELRRESTPPMPAE